MADGYGLSVLNGVDEHTVCASASVASTSILQGISLAAILAALAAAGPSISVAGQPFSYHLR